MMTKFNTFATFLIDQDLFEDKVDVILSKQGDKLFSAYEQDMGRDLWPSLIKLKNIAGWF